MMARLSICYAAPGHRLVPTAGTARNMLSLATALSEFADVTLAFRHVPGDRGLPGLVSIERGREHGGDEADDVAQRGLNALRHLGYLRTLTAFAGAHRRAFDVVLEKGWRLSGTLLAAFRGHGVPGVLVENDIRAWCEAIRSVRTATKYAAHHAADAVARRASARVPIIAETEELKALLVARGADPDRVVVIELGVDHALFRPQHQGRARAHLDINRAVTVLTYVGAMDKYHDVRPVIEGLADAGVRAELHIVGDGTHRVECEAYAAHRRAAVHFHGRVPHSSVPDYIAAADACVSAYRDDAFPGRTVPFSTLKVPEYMACARPVVGNAGGAARALLEDGISACLFRNEASEWRRFFADLPSREHLAEMGLAAAKAAEPLSWKATAARYAELCERVVATHRRSR
jgi:glycosyltransferase involved in cell wall biosynthesis